MSHRQQNRSTTPLILVDIDGVLNAFASRGRREHERTTVAGRYRVVLDTRHPGWFDVLADHAELWWATMWQAQAGPVFGVVAGLGHDWPYLDFDGAYEPGGSPFIQRTGEGVGGYKWPRILEMGATNRPLVWIDDDMDDAHLEWAAARDASGVPTLFVRPDPAEGFTFEHFLRVLAFSRSHGRRALTGPTDVLDPSGTVESEYVTPAEIMRRTA